MTRVGLVRALMHTHVIVIARENFSNFNRAPRALDYVMWQIQLCKVLSAFNAIQTPQLDILMIAGRNHWSIFRLFLSFFLCVWSTHPACHRCCPNPFGSSKKKEICHKNWLPFSQRAYSTCRRRVAGGECLIRNTIKIVIINEMCCMFCLRASHTESQSKCYFWSLLLPLLPHSQRVDRRCRVCSARVMLKNHIHTTWTQPRSHSQPENSVTMLK